MIFCANTGRALCYSIGVKAKGEENTKTTRRRTIDDERRAAGRQPWATVRALTANQVDGGEMSKPYVCALWHSEIGQQKKWRSTGIGRLEQAVGNPTLVHSHTLLQFRPSPTGEMLQWACHKTKGHTPRVWSLPKQSEKRQNVSKYRVIIDFNLISTLCILFLFNFRFIYSNLFNCLFLLLSLLTNRY